MRDSSRSSTLTITLWSVSKAVFRNPSTPCLKEVKATPGLSPIDIKIRHLIREELERGSKDDSYPVKPQRIVADIRAAMGEEDIVLVDTGAVKMWMARLYPTYRPNTCLISNGLSTMAFAFPGAIAAKLAFPERKVLAVAGDAGFLMNSQELETAVREQIPVVVLVWVDRSYGLIKWKMDIELGRHLHVDFGNPDFVKLAESYGAKGYAIKRTEDLLPRCGAPWLMTQSRSSLALWTTHKIWY